MGSAARLLLWPLFGAVVLVVLGGGAALVQFLIRILAGQSSPSFSALGGLKFLGLLAILGGSGGVSAGLVRPLVQKMDDDREYVIGVAAAFGYLTAMVWVVPQIYPNALDGMSLSEGTSWLVIVVLSIVFGIGITRGWRNV